MYPLSVETTVRSGNIIYEVDFQQSVTYQAQLVKVTHQVSLNLPGWLVVWALPPDW